MSSSRLSRCYGRNPPHNRAPGHRCHINRAMDKIQRERGYHVEMKLDPSQPPPPVLLQVYAPLMASRYGDRWESGKCIYWLRKDYACVHLILLSKSTDVYIHFLRTIYMGGHHHHEPYKFSDPFMYKVEAVPQLMEVMEALVRKGLQDPWLRNEVWRFDPKHHGKHHGRLLKVLFRGFPIGPAAFVATIGVEYALVSGDRGHGHGDLGEGH